MQQIAYLVFLGWGEVFGKGNSSSTPPRSLFARVNLPTTQLNREVSTRETQHTLHPKAGPGYFLNPFSLSKQQKENSGNKSYKNMRTIGKKSLPYRFVSCSNTCGMWFSLLLMQNITKMPKDVIFFLNQSSPLICLYYHVKIKISQNCQNNQHRKHLVAIATE